MMNIQYLDRLTAPTNFENRSKVEKSAKEFFFCVSHPKTIPLIDVFFWFHIFSGKKNNPDELRIKTNHNKFWCCFWPLSARGKYIVKSRGKNCMLLKLQPIKKKRRVTW